MAQIQALRAEMPLFNHVVTMRAGRRHRRSAGAVVDDLMARGADVAEAVLDVSA